MLEPITPTPKEDSSAVPAHGRTSGPRTMDFPDAIRAVTNGSIVARVSWGDAGDYGLLKDGWLTIYTKGKYDNWRVSDGDLEGRDWIVVIEGQNGKSRS